MDNVSKTFDKWALNGRSELMEKEHGKTVLTFLKSIRFGEPFSFLDIGCGNGWIVREISRLKNCTRAVGIDKSSHMIKNAKSKSVLKKEHYIDTDLESWAYRGKFDYVFAMESIYYSESILQAVKKAYRLLRDDGVFFCGTDFYSENKATARWQKAMTVKMHLLSKQEWRSIFQDAGFKVRVRHVRDPNSRKKWRRELGTLFIIGKKQAV